MTRPCTGGAYVCNVKHQEWCIELHVNGMTSVTRTYDIIGSLFRDDYQNFQEFVLNERHFFQSRVVFSLNNLLMSWCFHVQGINFLTAPDSA